MTVSGQQRSGVASEAGGIGAVDTEMASGRGPTPEIGRVLAVMSGKGGVGKSTVSALLAVALRRAGHEVGLLDADITGASIPRLFGIREGLVAAAGGIVPATTSSGIKVVSMNLLLEREDQAVVWRGPLIGSAIRQFWEEVIWGELDTLVVDLPPGTADAPLTVMQTIPLNGVVLVTSPQELAGVVVRKAADMATQMRVPVIGLIENMSYLVCPRCGEHLQPFGPSHAAEIADELGVPLLGRLPMDPEIARLGDAGGMESYESRAAAAIAERALSLARTEQTRPMFGEGRRPAGRATAPAP